MYTNSVSYTYSNNNISYVMVIKLKNELFMQKICSKWSNMQLHAK